MSFDREYSSFRDPSGQVFHQNGVLYRQINACYLPQYTHLMNSGLYEKLQKHHALVPHEEVELLNVSGDCAQIIRPAVVPYISYPYEWTFSQLKDAALLTLKLHRRAMQYGMILKDASAYNIQFINGQAMLIDTLSFDFYKEGMPWIAYGQFCRHFLAPLMLMSYVDIRFNKMLTNYIDGIPLDLASKILKGKGGFFAKQHIHWHAASISRHAEDGKTVNNAVQTAYKGLEKKQHLNLIESLIQGIEKLKPKDMVTEWGDYYAHTNYSGAAAGSKEHLVKEYLNITGAKNVWDLGANDGTYSRLALEQGAHVVAFDIDPVAVDRNYYLAKKEKLAMLPLILDLTTPSPAIGFANRERQNIQGRQQPDCVMVLAVIHHMAISNNLPLPMLAQWFAELGEYLIIEFVPKEDSQVKILLATREDIFPGYTKEGFEKAFGEYFDVVKAESVSDSCRTLYLLRRKDMPDDLQK